MMEQEGKLYVSTGTTKEVYQQMKEDGHIAIIALKQGTRDWIRVKGIATECKEQSKKEIMLKDCPVLAKRFASADCEGYALFEIEVVESYMNTNEGVQWIE